MKKNILILFILCALLCGCNKNKGMGTYIDYNYMFREGTGVVSMTAAEKGYYFAMNDKLYYADADTMKIVPVCSKVDCLHEAKPQCDAYIGESLSWFGYVQYYDGYVYTVSDMGMNDSNYYLWRISTDGTRKEKILKINSLDNVVMHHGYIFYIECIYDIDGGPNEQIIYKVNLSDNKKEIVYNTSGELYDMAAYRDYVYFAVYESEDAGVYAYNIKSGSIIKAEMPEGAVDMRSIQFMNDKLIFTYWYSSGDERNCRIYSSNLDFKNREELFRMKNSYNRIGCDNRYIYEDNYMNKDVYKNNLYDRSMTIYDINGNLIDSVDIGNTGTYCSGYGDDNYVFVRTEESIYYFDKKEIGTGNIQVKTLRG